MQQPPHGYDPNQQYHQQGYYQPPPQPPPPQGPPPKQGMGTGTKILLALLGLSVLGFGSCAVCVAIGAKGAASAVEKVNAEKAAQEESDREAKAEASVIGIEKLLSDYKDNEVRADGQYKGHYFKVTGKVDDIKKDIMDSPYVTIGTGKQFEIPQVQCALTKDSVDAAMQLSKGATVTVVGKVDGLMMNVRLKDCSIQ